MAASKVSAAARFRPQLASGAIAVAGCALVALLLLGFVLADRFIAAERARDLVAWQSRLGLIADGRAVALADWVERQFGEMTGLAENVSVQLYMTELSAEAGDRSQVADEPAQAGYLRNLLIVTAQRGGFRDPAPPPAINANLRRLGIAGIALLDAQKRPLVATPEMPPLDGRLAAFLADLPAGGRALLDIFAGADGAPAMAFVVPIFSVEGGDSRQIGYALGLKPVAGELFSLLRPPGPAEKGAETVLVRPAGAAVEYLSPLSDGTSALQRRAARDTQDLAEAFALDAPGGFALKRDYRGIPVLVTGRAVAATPWVVVYQVERDVALGESDRRSTRLAIYAALGLAMLAVVLAAVWYYATSRRAAQAAADFRALAERFASQGKLLRLVTDSQPNAIFIVDEDGRYRFANREAARRAGLAETDLLGKSLAQVLGPAVAERYVRPNKEALAGDTPVRRIARSEHDGEATVLQSAHVPLPEGPDLPRSVLVVEQDVTDVVRERERRERILKQLVRAMTAAVDRRDRYAADQSTRVAALAFAIAGEMGLDPVLAETAETAGNLMNFGKLLVPTELLSKAGKLSTEEIALIRSSIQATADIIAGIEFDGPVVATLRQMQEHWDGSGPHGLKGEAIAVSARIVAVANAFVAMASPRAYRAGSDVDAALTELLGKVGSLFDRRVVAALVAYLDNRGGRARWVELSRGRAEDLTGTTG
ncbi:MAG TPA: HD domain-containing phosphohydrolase [Stellaceae bacterium]|nr:HD domain-containing phosphohydrolase [Stellaceae bacterium]